MNGRDYVEGLRELARFYEDNPDFPISTGTLLIRVSNREQLVACADALGSFKKVIDDEFYNLRRSFGPILLEVWTNKGNVCTSRVVGIKHHDEEIIEWDCEEPLMGIK